MGSALGYFDGSSCDPENQPVLFVDSNTPKSGKIPFQRFRLPFALITVSGDVFQYFIDLFQRLSIFVLPVNIIFPRGVRPY